MKGFKSIISILILVLVGISIWNKIQLEKCKKLVELKNFKNTEWQQANEANENALIKSLTISMRHLGKKLSWSNVRQLYPETSPTGAIYENPRLVLVFSELSCNVCQDKETQFAVNIAEDFGKEFVVAIIHASSKRYIQSYIRLNQVSFPVFYCDDSDKTFFEKNKIVSTPMLFVIDKANRIIASHIPIPGQFQYSEPIHQFCYHYFNQFDAE